MNDLGIFCLSGKPRCTIVLVKAIWMHNHLKIGAGTPTRDRPFPFTASLGCVQSQNDHGTKAANKTCSDRNKRLC